MMENQCLVTNHRYEVDIDTETLPQHIKPEPVEDDSEETEFDEDYDAGVKYPLKGSGRQRKRIKDEREDNTFPKQRIKDEIPEESVYNDEPQNEEFEGEAGSVSEDEEYDQQRDESNSDEEFAVEHAENVDNITRCDKFNKRRKSGINEKVNSIIARVVKKISSSSSSSSQINGGDVVNDERNDEQDESLECNESKEQVEKPLICDVCTKAFKRLSHLKRHKLIHSDYRPFQCHICMVKFSTSSNLKRHISIRKCKPPHTDDIIKGDSKEKSDSNFREDLTIPALPSTSSENDKMIYFEIPPADSFQQCNKCLKFSIAPKDYKSDNIYICTNCINEDDTQCEVGVKDFNVYECDICTKKFDRSSTLNRHKLIHTGDKFFECDICAMKFNLLCNLKQHKRIHTNNRLFVCNVCGKNFRQSSNLKQHKLIHTGDKPYQCNICLKKFNQSSTLKTHKRTHTGEKPFECDICKKKFSWSYHLKRHAITHQTVEKIECNLCGVLFSHPSYLQRHMQKKHPDFPLRPVSGPPSIQDHLGEGFPVFDPSHSDSFMKVLKPAKMI